MKEQSSPESARGFKKAFLARRASQAARSSSVISETSFFARRLRLASLTSRAAVLAAKRVSAMISLSSLEKRARTSRRRSTTLPMEEEGAEASVVAAASAAGAATVSTVGTTT